MFLGREIKRRFKRAGSQYGEGATGVISTLIKSLLRHAESLTFLIANTHSYFNSESVSWNMMLVLLEMRCLL